VTPDLAEGHIALGTVYEQHDWNWVAAQTCLQRALELAPGHADALRAAAHLNGVLGRTDEALALMRRVVTLDPLSARTQRQMARACFQAGRFDDAAAGFKLALDLNPQAGLLHAFLAIVRLWQGRPEEALALAEAESHAVFRRLAIAMAAHALGRPAQSDAALHELSDEWGWTAAYQVAEAHSYRQEIDSAFEWLEKAYAQRDPGVTFTPTDPMLWTLRGDPRWRPFVRKLGLEQ